MVVHDIVAMGGGGFSMDDPLLDRYVLALVDKPRPKVCFLPTASGDAPDYSEKFRIAFTAYGVEPSVLSLFYRDIPDITHHLLSQDIIYVGGGNTVNMLAIWKLHGVDVALRAASEAGVVLAGLSAGANCWFESFTTDSYRMGGADPAEGLGFLRGSFSPHHSSEPARRPSFNALIAAGALPDGYACDDYAAIHFVGDTRQAITSRPEARAFEVRRAAGGSSAEQELNATLLG